MMLWTLAAALSAAAPGCTQATEDMPALCPAALPAIRKVVVERNGQTAWKETNPPTSCRHFTLTPHQVCAYFAQARLTDHRSVHYTLPESPCYASGKITFADGRTGQWTIEQFAIATLTFNGGDTSHEPITLYCPTCTKPPFMQ